MVIETKVVIGLFKLQLKMWLVDLNYNFELACSAGVMSERNTER